jgi:hypothetical protein
MASSPNRKNINTVAHLENGPGSTLVSDGLVSRDAAQHESGSPRAPPRTAQSGKGLATSPGSEPGTPLYSFVNIMKSPKMSTSPRPRFASPPPATPPTQESGSHPDVKFQLGKVYDTVPGVIGFACCKDKKQTLAAMKQNPKLRFFTSECHSEYEPFGADFGPIDLAVVYKFCNLLQEMMNKEPSKHHIYYCGDKQADVVKKV